MVSPLDGVKVVDMGWLMVAPFTARYLGELGATVVKLESRKRPDPLRGLGGSPTGYHMINAGKAGLAVDIKEARGREAVLRLIDWADVFIESFTPGVIDELGLSYDLLKRSNPGLIMLSTGILGRRGTHGLGMSGTGTTGSAYAGATNLIGWPDRKPVGPLGPWTDAVAPRFAAASILAALHRRVATGTGEYIDLAQAEAGLQYLLPGYLEAALNGDVPQRRGGIIDPLRAPCGAYRCLGEDRWILIDASDPAAWERFAAILGLEAQSRRFNLLVGRLRAREDLDALISAWTRTQNAETLTVQLQAIGVPAHVVCQDSDYASDQDLEADNFFRNVSDPILGDFVLQAPQFTMTGTPHVPRRAGPVIGDSSRRVLTEYAQLSDEEIAELEQMGALT